MHMLAGGDGVVVLAPLVAVGRIDELEVEAFVRQRDVGKGDAEHGEKYEVKIAFGNPCSPRPIPQLA